MTSVTNTDASLPYNHGLFESLIVKKRIKYKYSMCHSTFNPEYHVFELSGDKLDEAFDYFAPVIIWVTEFLTKPVNIRNCCYMAQIEDTWLELASYAGLTNEHKTPEKGGECDSTTQTAQLARNRIIMLDQAEVLTFERCDLLTVDDRHIADPK
ncbi:hypothetical protein CLF_111982 [Clonorchis sinensis]|uniref:Uncharacterized protein n=1 Tax=Clonorchis sinensis TaxID=79923 RepID=G7YVM3_CLOSI|nr:hypothetical protein CLF_111982 [Clonorchis sinensis]